MAKIFSYRGKSLEELQKMDINTFATLVKARERRALKRMSYQYKKLLEKVEKAKEKNKPIKTRLREAVILPQWVGLKFMVHDGKEYKELRIEPEMLGHRLGDYVFTTKRVIHSTPGLRATRGSMNVAVK